MPKTLSLFIHAFYKIKFRMVAWLGGKTIGVRALVVREDEVLLVRHTYSRGWYTIGGAIEAGETPTQALARELQEEVGVELIAPPVFMGVYHSNFEKRDDYVVMYTVKSFSMAEGVVSPEIAEWCWFKIGTLPEDVSPATNRRIKEFMGVLPISEKW